MDIIQISLTEPQAKELRDEAHTLGSSIASIVRAALRDYFKQQRGKA